MTTHKDPLSLPALKSTLVELCEKIGERHLGSIGEEQAKDYLQQRFEALGYTVTREAFDTPGWNYGEWQLQAGEQLFESFPCYFSPDGTAEAPLLTYLEKRDRDLSIFAGKIVLAGNFDFTSVLGTNQLAEKLEQAGAKALIMSSPYNDTYSTKIIRTPKLCSMPVLTVSQRTALALAPLEGQIAKITLDAKCFDHVSHNIVARVEQPGAHGKLIIGAHYDTSPGIQGAQDNASGVALLLAVAEALYSQWQPWNIDLIAFGGEEFGGPGYGMGSYSYAQSHSCNVNNVTAMICLDGLGAWMTCPEIRIGRSPAMTDLAQSVCQRAGFTPVPYKLGSDQAIFNDQGIPTAWFCDGGASNGVRHFCLHSPQDRLDLIDMQQLQRIAEDVTDFISRLKPELFQ